MKEEDYSHLFALMRDIKEEVRLQNFRLDALEFKMREKEKNEKIM